MQRQGVGAMEAGVPAVTKRNVSPKFCIPILLLPLVQVFACTVGQKPSRAPFYLDDPGEVLKLLARLVDVSLPQHCSGSAAVVTSCSEGRGWEV